MSITNIKDYEEIVTIINHYVAGANVSMETARSAFHFNAMINGGPIERLFDAIDMEGRAKASTRIDILDVVGNIACARVVMENWHGKNFVDFLQLLNTEDGWEIISKIYQEF